MSNVSVKKFEYEPLSEIPSAFRLLRLFPGGWETKLECSLERQILEFKTSSYEALSYAWGDSTPSCMIVLNKNEFYVTTNLHLALRNLKHEKEERVLWVDAICINQACLPEKTQQVSQMRNIYQAAERVLVWLGDACFYTEAAMSWVNIQLERHGDNLELLTGVASLFMEGYHASAHDLADDGFPSKKQEVPDRRAQQLTGFTVLLSQPWWSRIWVVQEVVVNSDVSIVCGRSLASWDAFMAIVNGLYHSAPLLHAAPTQRDVFSRSIQRGFSRNQYSCKAPQTMSDLLSHHRGLQASDLRDHVYALLDISSDMSTTAFVPDYSRSTEEVFRRLVKKHVELNHDLTIICASQPSATPNITLPSWVPDWSSPWKYFCLSQVPFNACNDVPAHASFSPNMSTLTTVGKTLGTISSTSQPFESSGPVFITWLKRVQNWRTLIVDHELDTRRFTFAQFRRVWEKCIPDEEPVERVPPKMRKWKERISTTRVLRLENHIARVCMNRRLACLKRDDEVLEGLVPVDAMEGDKVVVLWGCKVPVVLRGGVDGWRFVGDAYVDGYMYGKAFQDPLIIYGTGNFEIR
jgi:hypothetical protein